MLLAALFDAAVAAANGARLIERTTSWDGRTWSVRCDDGAMDWTIPADGRVIVVGAGKAAASLALGMETVLGGRIDEGLVIVKHGHAGPLRRIRQLSAGHPIPDEEGLAASRELLALLSGLGPNDRVFTLLTGGASALLVQPVPGVSLQDKVALTELLLRSGATIEQINTVRKRLSLVKGGRLLRAAAPAPMVTLMIADVPGGDPATIGSGPTIVADERPGAALAALEQLGIAARVPASIVARLREPADAVDALADRKSHFIIGDERTAARAAQAAAERAGYAVEVVARSMCGDTHDEARRFATALRDAAARRDAGGPPTVLLASGETTLKVTGGGKGGRNQEFALVAARCIAGCRGVALLAAGTDGTDGPTDAAGAFADGTTLARARAQGIDPAAMLADNDSYHLFQALDDLHVTGATGTNVMDLVIGVVA